MLWFLCSVLSKMHVKFRSYSIDHRDVILKRRYLRARERRLVGRDRSRDHACARRFQFQVAAVAVTLASSSFTTER
jgi:hypothetical protein